VDTDPVTFRNKDRHYLRLADALYICLKIRNGLLDLFAYFLFGHADSQYIEYLVTQCISHAFYERDKCPIGYGGTVRVTGHGHGLGQRLLHGLR
jgi:hypothetical protein